MTIGKKDVLYKSLFLLFLIYFFLVSIRLMGVAFKLFGAGFAEALIAGTTSPFIGLFAGILATSLVQSSSCTTSIVVGLVASGSMTVSNAVPIVIGANIGTTVTNTLVSLGHIHRRDEFERAFAGATCHDLFNWLSVIVIFPLQVRFGIISGVASFLTGVFVKIGGIHIINPLKVATEPTVKLLGFACLNHPIIILILGVIILFVTLRFITRLMRGLATTRAEIGLNEHVFRSPMRAFLLGASLTSIIQSSSVATSLMVPVVGAGIVSVEKKFPYTLGTNVGTTVTAILASLATASPAAITIALSHLVFNVIGIAIFYPLRKIPIWLALRLGCVAARKRVCVAIYVVGLFYVLPLAMILIWR
jgi:sodium-dependent phosphate cotransporter